MLKNKNFKILSNQWINKLTKTVNSRFSSFAYTKQMYKAWEKNPSSVHESWQEYFKKNTNTEFRK